MKAINRLHLPPGHTIYSEGFAETLSKLTLKEEKNELFITLLDYARKVLSRAYNNRGNRKRNGRLVMMEITAVPNVV